MDCIDKSVGGGCSAVVISNQGMGIFNLSVYHGGRFGYDNGTLQYIRGQKTLIEDVESDCCSEWLEKDLKLFAGDRDELEMCRIAELRSHVELFVVHKVDDAKGFPEVGLTGGKGQCGVGYNEGDKLYRDVEAENARVESNSDDDSDDEEFIPSDIEVDSADDIQFTDSEEEYDDDSGFEELKGVTDSDRVDKGKRVVNGDFSDEEGFNNNEDRQDDDNDEATRYPIHKDVKDMTSYKWEVGTIYASREEFKDTITACALQTRRGSGMPILTWSRQVTLNEIQGTYRKQYKRIADYCSKLLRANLGSSVTLKTNFDDVMLPSYRRPSHRLVKKRKRGPDEAEDSSQSHLSRRGQIQKCSNCGESGHKRGGCKEPPMSAQQTKQSAMKRTNGGRKTSSVMPITRSKVSSQLVIQSATRGRKRSKRQQK
ncbi:hypothetical protein Ahy_A10g050681 [Arachis hypogaea]|uniref:CCHC-type domain-containing protein n=1 Tax=Arachis hypogaea TaxID=3818 RepID=A0A445BA33_ARAHY|nr:hypothetical protein Ahy_A10g050681 [Arachis hypogaea]